MEETGANTSEAVAEAVVTLFNEAWSGHDLAAALALTSEDCVFESTSPAPDGQRAVGQAAVRTAWQPIFADLRSSFTVEETFTAGCRVVQRWRYDWGDGHVRGVDLFTVQNGRVTEKLSYVKGLPGTARAGSRRMLVRHTFRPKPPNEYTCAGCLSSPARIPAVNSRHWAGERTRTGPLRSLESQTATSPGRLSATSTQAPPLLV